MATPRHPLRLKGKRWSEYSSRYWEAASAGDTPTETPGIGYPDTMVYSWADYSWEGRPVLGTDEREMPLFWTPDQAARTMDMSLADYIAAGFAPVLASEHPRPTTIPKAILYNTYGYGVFPGTEVDVVADAVASLETALMAKGVNVLRINTPYYLHDTGHAMGCVVLANSSTAACVAPPHNELGDQWEPDPVLGGNKRTVYRRLNGTPYRAGECMYISALSCLDLEWPYFSTLNNGAGNPPDYGLLQQRFDREVEYLTAAGDLHERCLVYSAIQGFDSYPPAATPPLAWTHTKDVVLPQLRNACPYFDFGTYTATSVGERDNGEEAVGPLTTLIKAKIQEFFNL